LPGFKVGKSWRFDRDEVIEVIRKARKRDNNRMKGNIGRERR
jgi:hypothetical protein